MREERVTFKSLDYELVGILNLPDKIPAPGVILFHGISNSKEDCPLIKETAKMLTSEGYVTFRFDFFGSGESPGGFKDKRMSILEQNARDAIDFFLHDNRVSEEIGIWGRSLGGTIVILLVDRPEVKTSVILSGAVSLEKVLGRSVFEGLKALEKELSKSGKNLPGTGKYKGAYDLEESWFKELPQYDKKIQESLPKLHNVLVFGTTPDKKAPLEQIIAIVNGAREPKEIHIFEGVDHDYKGAEKSVIEIEKRWFKTYLGRA
jgi:dienelactone hydrolase